MLLGREIETGLAGGIDLPSLSFRADPSERNGQRLHTFVSILDTGYLVFSWFASSVLLGQSTLLPW